MAQPENPALLELDVPDGLGDAAQAVEVVRAWVADGNLLVSLNGEAFGDRLEEWGRLLAQIGQHVANAATMNGRVSNTDPMTAIRQGFDAALAATDAPFAGKVRGRVRH